MEKTLLIPILTIFSIVFQNATAQTHTCMVYDDLTQTERATLGISQQEFQTYLNQRDLFDADAFVTKNTLQAVSINEPAVYNWYDANGNLLHTGQNYTVNNTNGTYLLEVIADYDGYKDMKEVTISPINTLLLHNIYPNPATSNVTVQYNQLNCNNAYIMLVNVNSNASANYILNLNNTSININTAQYTPGLYRVVLVCDNNVIESHNLIIQ